MRIKFPNSGFHSQIHNPQSSLDGYLTSMGSRINISLLQGTKLCMGVKHYGVITTSASPKKGEYVTGKEGKDADIRKDDMC